ncbi:MAG: hypothetical protein M3082_06380 [Candidatus Dormibacteraeota bacterium]|nr:hypothetical protein [Candidatus Dormibacteraeota bacterium]
MRLPLVGELHWAVLRLGRVGAGRAGGVIGVWAAWERLMLWLHPLQPVLPGGLFLFRVQTHRGRHVILADGTAVRRGDMVLELHLGSARLLRLRESPGFGAWRAVGLMRADLAALGDRLAAGDMGPVAALHGTSLIGGAGGRLGFEVRELPRNWRAGFVQYFLAGIDAIYHPTGLGRLRAGRVRERRPVEVWMSARGAAAMARTLQQTP